MRRYDNSYRMIHLNSAGVGDAISTITEHEYDTLKRARFHGTSFQGNGVVKTVLVHDFYDLYETVRNSYLKRQLGKATAR